MPHELTYQFGRNITKRPGIVNIHQKYWKIEGDEENPANFRYTFRDLTDLQRKIENTDHGFACVHVDDEPGIILETMLLQTSGNNDEIPKTFDDLTGRDYSKYNMMGNTRVFVTFTVDAEKRHIKPYDDRRLPDLALEQFIDQYRDAEFKITYSPFTQAAINLHTRHGARPVALLRSARPNLCIQGESAEDVIVMGYAWPKFMPEDQFAAIKARLASRQEVRAHAFV